LRGAKYVREQVTCACAVYFPMHAFIVCALSQSSRRTDVISRCSAQSCDSSTPFSYQHFNRRFERANCEASFTSSISSPWLGSSFSDRSSAIRNSDFFAPLPRFHEERRREFIADDSPLQIFADYYQILGVARNASKEDIKRAYRKLARKYHPDVNKDAGAEDKFKEIARANEILSDPDLRARYDQFGEAGVRSGAGGGVDMGDMGGLGDIFETFFGGGFGGMGGRRGGVRERQAVTGDDLRVDLEIDFKVAVFGGEETIKIAHLEKCAKCEGSGAKPGSGKKKCSTCGGQGQVARSTRTPFGSFSQVTVCPTCEGEGEMIESSCTACSGAGRIRANKKLSVGIPAGVDSGSRLRIRSEGDAGPKGGPPGDLYVYVKVRADPQFRREGQNIYSNAKISYVDAILGTKVPVQTVDGEQELEIPTGTQPNTVLKIRGKGVPRLGNSSSRGDQFVTVIVEIPTRVGGKEKKIIEELKKVTSEK